MLAAPLADVKARENSRWCETMLSDREAAGKRRRGLDTARREGRMEWRGRMPRPLGRPARRLKAPHNPLAGGW